MPGVGPKTAAKWINQYDGLENVIANVDLIGGKAGQNLRDNLDLVLRNRRLNRLLTDLELPLAVDDLARRPLDREEVHRVFDALEFDTLRQRLFETLPEEETTEPAEGLDVDVVPLDRLPGGLGPWLEARRGTLLGVDVTGSAAQGTGDAWALAIADGEGHAVAIDLTTLPAEEEQVLAGWLADPAQPKTLHEAKFAWHALDGRGLQLDGIVFDTALAAYLCHPDQRRYALPDLTIRHLRRELRDDDEPGGQGVLDLDGVAADTRGGVRASAVVELTAALRAELADRGAADLLESLELPVQRVLERMEKVGIAADVPNLEELQAGLRPRGGAGRVPGVRGDRPRGQPLQPQAAAGGPLRRARHAQDEEDQDGLHHRRRRPGGPLRQDPAPVPPAPPRAPRPDPAAPDGRGAAALGLPGRPHPHHLPPDHRRHRPAQLHRPQPAEHPGAHRGRAARCARASSWGRGSRPC